MTTSFWGTLVGMVAGSYLADQIGRKRSLIVSAIFLMLGAVGSAVSSTLLVWNALRLLGGMGGGLAVLVAPMYISEIAPPHKRGALVTFHQMGVVVGAFGANLGSYVVAKYLGANPECWRWMFASGCLPAGIFLVCLVFVPETPRWLLMKGRPQEARAVLKSVGDAERTEDTIQEIDRSLDQKVTNYRELLRPGMRIGLLISSGLAIFDQWVGVPTLVLYAPSLFVKAGISSSAGAIGNTVLIRIVDVLSVLFALFWLDKFGRRPLLLYGTLGIAAGQILMGICFYRHTGPLFILMAFFWCEATFNSSLPPVGWLITTEVFPTQLRARGMAIHGSLRFGSSLLLAQLFPPMVEFFRAHFGSEASVFWFFAILCFASFVFSFLLVPETKGRTLEQTSESYVAKQ